MSLFHFGVVKALYEEGLLPKIISGTSAGAIVASCICTTKKSELHKLFKEGGIKFDTILERNANFSYLSKLKRFFTKFSLFEVQDLMDSVRENTGDLTFQEAYD